MMSLDSKPDSEIDVDADLVRRLLEEQHPHLVASLTPLDEGWDNFVFRLGSEYAVRLPRRAAAAELIRHEQRWLPAIAERLPVPVPAPVAVGVASDVYPWPWSVVPWLSGATADVEPLQASQAGRLATVLRRLHRRAPDDAPANPFRGVPLADRGEIVEERMERFDSPRLSQLWRRAVGARPPRDAVWIHGDLHPRNVLVRDGTLAGILDWGDLTAGDPATDLSCAWMLFGARGRAAFLDAYGATESQRLRAVGWAINLALALACTSEPRHLRLGRRILAELGAGATGSRPPDGRP